MGGSSEEFQPAEGPSDESQPMHEERLLLRGEDQLDVEVHGRAERVHEQQLGSAKPSRALACGSPVRQKKRTQPDVKNGLSAAVSEVGARRARAWNRSSETATWRKYEAAHGEGKC
jgi:hypothetical protein